MRFWQIRLQLQSALCQSTCFFAPRWCRIERVHNPAFQLRIAGNRKREGRIQVEGTLEKLLALFQFFEILKSAGKIVRLHESQISLAVFSGSAFELGSFAR